MKLDLTLDELKFMRPCSGRFTEMRPMFGLLGQKRVTLRQAAKCGASLSDLLWVAGNLAETDNRMMGLIVQFSLDCAMSCHTTSPQPEYLVQVVSADSAVVAALLSDRKPNQTETQAAWSAESAAWSAWSAESAESAAWSAWSAWSAAWAAAWAAWAAAWAAWSAEWAARSQQRDNFVKLLYKYNNGRRTE